MARPVDFAAIAAAALPYLPALCARWLPGGRRVGSEWICRNPTRADRNPGSFKINLKSGRWADFSTGDCGRDAVSLAAYLSGVRQHDAALELARMLGLSDGGAQ